MPKERLDKILVFLGCGSRREVDALVRAGRVTAAGQICRAPDAKIDPETDQLTLDGQVLRYQKNRYFMLNKPKGVVSATEDRTEQTVLSLLPARETRGLFPVGRLDKDTEGLLLLTDDGMLGHLLTSPKHHVDKVYLAGIDGDVAADAAERFAAGLSLADGTACRPAVYEQIGKADGLIWARITLREGKFHQVKRMVQAVGGQVVSLKRIAMGGLRLDEALAPGAWRELTTEELRSLQQAAGTPSD
jgi:16S rRNA pseudouridine516 synthase